MNPRFLAIRVIQDIIDQRGSLSDNLPNAIQKLKNPLDQSFLQALCYGICRWYDYLDALASFLLKKPLKDKDFDVHLLILIGLYQLMFTRIPDYAAISETVAVTVKLKKIWAKGFINGVLREFQRNTDYFKEKLTSNSVTFYSHPAWLAQKIQTDWSIEWKAILEANNQHPPFTLRVNTQRISRKDYVSQFENNEVTILPETSSGFILSNAIDVLKLPGFSKGFVSVQDGAAQLAANLLELEPNQRVLDACAAPGGKTTHILETQSKLQELVAIDSNEKRLNLVRENLNRLGVKASCVCADVGDLSVWWDQKLFDRILLDVPCSATGVIRRHPDIKLLRQEEDIAFLVTEQTRLLNSVWKTLKPGGMLLYATCSILQEENSNIVKNFLETHADAKEEKINAGWGKELMIGRQILPGMHNMDGFYYARLRKI